MIDILIKAFEYGVDYGLLIAERERDSEEMYDGCQCSVFAKKMCMPSMPSERRQAHSEEWRKAKKKSITNFVELCRGIGGNENDSE